jgi:hypothetical protein
MASPTPTSLVLSERNSMYNGAEARILSLTPSTRTEVSKTLPHTSFRAAAHFSGVISYVKSTDFPPSN